MYLSQEKCVSKESEQNCVLVYLMRVFATWRLLPKRIICRLLHGENPISVIQRVSRLIVDQVNDFIFWKFPILTITCQAVGNATIE